MNNWNKITLYKFQQIEAVNRREDLSDEDKMLFSTCVYFGLTEYELDNNIEPTKALKMINEVANVFSQPFAPISKKRIGKFFINYDPATMNFGQFVELSFFLQDPITNAHYVMSSISNTWLTKNKSEQHKKKSQYFLTVPITKITGCITLIVEKFKTFNNEYSKLWGLDDEVHSNPTPFMKSFNKRYGWVFAASQIAEYERIPVEKVYQMPVRQALNNLAYLKAKSRYEVESLKNN